MQITNTLLKYFFPQNEWIHIYIIDIPLWDFLDPRKSETHKSIRRMTNHHYCQTAEGLKTTPNNGVYNFVGTN